MSCGSRPIKRALASPTSARNRLAAVAAGNAVVLKPSELTPLTGALVEELFPAAAVHDVHAFYGSGGDDAELARRLEQLMASVARIGADRDLDLVPTSRHLWDLADVATLSRERPATPSSR